MQISKKYKGYMKYKKYKEGLKQGFRRFHGFPANNNY